MSPAEKETYMEISLENSCVRARDLITVERVSALHPVFSQIQTLQTLCTGEIVLVKDYKKVAQTVITSYVVNRFFSYLFPKLRGRGLYPQEIAI